MTWGMQSDTVWGSCYQDIRLKNLVDVRNQSL